MVNKLRGLDFHFNLETRTQNRNGLPYRAMSKLEQLKTEVILSGFRIIREEVRENTW